MTIDNIFKRFLKEERVYNTGFKNVKFSRYVDGLFNMHYPSSRIIREEKDFWKRQDLMYKFDRLDKKWKYSGLISGSKILALRYHSGSTRIPRQTLQTAGSAGSSADLPRASYQFSLLESA